MSRLCKLTKLIGARFTTRPNIARESDFSCEIMEDTISSTITEMFNSFQDFLNNEQEVREVRIGVLLEDGAFVRLGYVAR